MTAARPARPRQAGARRRGRLVRPRVPHRRRTRRWRWCRSGTATVCRAAPATAPRRWWPGGAAGSPAGSAWTSSSSTSGPDRTPRGPGRRRGRALRPGRGRRADRPGLGRRGRHDLLRDRHPGRRAGCRAATSGASVSATRTLAKVGIGLAAAGVGAALGLAAERVTAGRTSADEDPRRRAHAVRRRCAAGPHGRGDRRDPAARRGRRPARRTVCRNGFEPARARPRPTVVFTHGFALNLDAWHFQRAALRGHYRLVFWDQRGHGRSATGPRGSSTIERSAPTSRGCSTPSCRTARSCSSGTPWAA